MMIAIAHLSHSSHSLQVRSFWKFLVFLRTASILVYIEQRWESSVWPTIRWRNSVTVAKMMLNFLPFYYCRSSVCVCVCACACERERVGVYTLGEKMHIFSNIFLIFLQWIHQWAYVICMKWSIRAKVGRSAPWLMDHRLASKSNCLCVYFSVCCSLLFIIYFHSFCWLFLLVVFSWNMLTFFILSFLVLGDLFASLFCFYFCLGFSVLSHTVYFIFFPSKAVYIHNIHSFFSFCWS